MIRRGRRSDPVPASYVRPAQLSADGLVVNVRGDRGEDLGEYDFSGLPVGLALRQALAAAFDRRTGATGTMKAARTCTAAHHAVTNFATWLGRQHPVPQGPSDLSPRLWKEWHRGAKWWETVRVRPLLTSVTGLPHRTALLLQSTVLGSQESEPARPPSDAEIARIRVVAGTVFDAGLERIRFNTELLGAWRAGQVDDGTDRWHLGYLLDRVSRAGCLTSAGADGCQPWIDVPLSTRHAYQRSLGESPTVKPPRSLRLLHERLYLNTQETIAAALLLVVSGQVGEGDYNRGVIERMEITAGRPDAGTGGRPIRTVIIDKPRRGARSARTSESLADRGAGSFGRLYARIEEATGPARDTLAACGQPTRRLLVYRSAGGSHGKGSTGGLSVGLPGSTGRTWTNWAEEFGLIGDDGGPVNRGPRALRKAVVARSGMARQHGRRTHDNVYALADAKATGSHDDVTEQGLHDAHEHANTTVGVRWLRLGDAKSARAAEALGVPPEVVEEILRGTRDTAAAACRDHLDGPHAPAGEPCPASFLSCFACANAVATPSHTPRLVYLAEALEALRRTLDPGLYAAQYADPAARLHALLERHTTPEERAEARTRLVPEHRRIIDDLLARRWDA